MRKVNPISLHPDNPRYFCYNGKPTVLVGSCEDYGCLMNLAFDYHAYLRELKRCGLNHDRVFSGVYREIEGESFGIVGNVMAPDEENYVGPWARSDQPSAKDGGNLFDLDSWDERFWERLHGYMGAALEQGIIVEFVLFCTFYQCYFGENLWELSALHPANNINGTEPVGANCVLALENRTLRLHMERLTRKFVQELSVYPNLIIEICNEPWNDDIPETWLLHMAQVVRDAELALGVQHLISLDVSCGYLRLEAPMENISVYNFHYDMGQTAKDNYALGLPIGLNETGFWGQGDTVYRRQAWQFMLSGGALFTNLDYSFSAGHESGTFACAGESQPGGGSKVLREQLGYLLAFLDSLPLTKMRPGRDRLHMLFANNPLVTMLCGETDCCGFIQSDTDSQLMLSLPAGRYHAVSLDPITGAKTGQTLSHENGGMLRVSLPKPCGEEMAFGVLRVDICEVSK